MPDNQGKIRLGVVGATPDRGWAASAHIPAIAAVPHFALTGVATRRAETARAAAAAFGAPLAFDDPLAMIAHPNIDAVAVVVKAPDHFPLVERALEAGKHIYCEWPLGRSFEEAEALAGLAARTPVVTAIGLQARFSPWVNQVRQIVAAGELGRILSTTLFAYDELSVGSIAQGNAYMLDASNGANGLTIHGGHDIDALCYVLGEFVSLSASLATTRPDVVVRETGEVTRATSPDQSLVCGQLEGGAMASAHIRAGKGEPSVVWEIQGDRATLRATCAGYLNWHPLDLRIWTEGEAWQDVAPPEPAKIEDFLGLPLHVRNVARAYAAFADDILHGSGRSASFAMALQRHRMLAAIQQASGTQTAVASIGGRR